MLDLRAESDIVLVLRKYMTPVSHKVLYKLELAGRQVIFVSGFPLLTSILVHLFLVNAVRLLLAGLIL
jgi:hypothetical protein